MDRSDPFGRSCFGKAEGELNLPLAAFHEGHPQSRESSIQGRQTSPEGRHAHRLDHDAGSPESGTVVRACVGVGGGISILARYHASQNIISPERYPMNFRCLTTASTVCGLLFLCRPLDAWNDAGHLVIARLAWERLSEPQREKVVNVLSEHPHKHQILLQDRPENVSVTEWLFIRAAIWCDHIRPPRGLTRAEIYSHTIYKYHHGPWHYVNFPYSPRGKENPVPSVSLRGEASDSSTILDQLELSMKVLQGPEVEDLDRVVGLTTAQNKAVRLCWLFHLIGDIHQPLHAATLIDERRIPIKPHSDQGGNLFAIRSQVAAFPRKLHVFWDECLGTDSRYPAIRSLSETLSHDPAFTPEHLPELSQHRSFRAWALESHLAARTEVYERGHLQCALWDDYEHGKITAEDVPRLSPEAESKAKTLARRRIALAGCRLAEKLQEIVDP